MEQTDKIIEMLNTISERLNHLEQIINSKQSPWRDIKGTAEYLNISTRTIRRLVSAGTIPFVRRETISGKAKLFFHRKQLNLWMFTGSSKSN